MRSFVLIAVLAVAVNARPELPSGNGYNYRPPAPAPAPYQQSSFGVSSGGNSGYTNGGYQSGSGNAGFSQQQQPQTIVQKHIYVHVPPPEEESQSFPAQQSFAQPRKHYKIIFIKAPSAPSISQQIAAAQSQNEEKTLIYVLVKKPEDVSIPDQPAQIQLPVSKPEVYFIKYKTQKENAGGDAFSSSNGNSFGGGHSSGGNAFGGGHSSGGNAFGGGQSTGGGFDIAPANPQATYGAPIKK